MFSGVGGFDLAARNCGIEVAGACEINETAKSIYKRHFPDVPVWEDATTLDPGSVGRVDFLFGGPPCEPFSYAGDRRGADDPRGTLFHEVVRVAREVQPSFLLLENVQGLLSSGEGKVVFELVSTLLEIGYGVSWRYFHSKYHTSQDRVRVFIIGRHRGKRGRRVPLIIEGKEMPVVHDKKGKGKRAPVQGQNINTITAGYGRLNCNGETYVEVQDSMPGPYVMKTTRDYESLDGVPLRYLTPTEIEKLQGFPRDWTKYGHDGKEISRNQRYVCLGKAVSVPVVEEIISELMLGKA